MVLVKHNREDLAGEIAAGIRPGEHEGWEDKFDANLDRDKLSVTETLRGRQCPMLLGALAKLSGLSCDGSSGGARVIMTELLDEGKIAAKHMPDGNDLYYVPGSKADPAAGAPPPTPVRGLGNPCIPPMPFAPGDEPCE